MASKRWGQAWIEVTANKPLILQRLVEGYSIRRVYEELRGQGLITVARSNFHDAMNKLKAEAQPVALPALAPVRPLSRLSLPSSESSNASVEPEASFRLQRFEHDNSVSPDFRLTPKAQARNQGSKKDEG